MSPLDGHAQSEPIGNRWGNQKGLAQHQPVEKSGPQLFWGDEMTIDKAEQEHIERMVDAANTGDKMKDRDLLCMCYGAFRAINDPKLDLLCGMLESRLFLAGRPD